MCENHSLASDRVWLPYIWQGCDLGLQTHQYCQNCGLVKNDTSDRPKGLGYYYNIVSQLVEEQRLPEVIRRQISHDITEQLSDTWALTGTQQNQIFIEIVKTKAPYIPQNTVTGFL
jgi:hypothetical protein